MHPKKKDDKCFLFAATLVLNYGKIKWNPERISNVKPFINKYNYEKLKHSSKIDGWKTFEKNNSTITLKILHTKDMEKCQNKFQKCNININ